VINKNLKALVAKTSSRVPGYPQTGQWLAATDGIQYGLASALHLGGSHDAMLADASGPAWRMRHAGLRGARESGGPRKNGTR